MKTKVLQVRVSGDTIPEYLNAQWLVNLLKATDRYVVGKWEPEPVKEKEDSAHE